MRAWERVTLVARCGSCGEVLTEGAAIQTIQFTNQKRKLIRCEMCAEGPRPLELPMLPTNYEHGERTKRMTSLKSAASNFRAAYRETP